MNPLIQALRPITSRVRTDVTAVKKEGASVWTREELTDVRIAKHLNGGPARGCCPIKAGESTTLVGLFDLDSHKGETPWDEMTAIAQELVDALEMVGMRPIPFRSSGGKGIHLIMLWDEPQDAYSVRAFMCDVLASLGYANGTGGVRAREIEVFPKQDSVPADGFGNQFILPLAGQSEPLEPLLGLQPMGREYAAVMDWPSSPAVPVLERPVRQAMTRVDPGALSLADKALMAIPNAFDRDAWFPVLCAYKEAAGEEGYDTAYAWSAQHDSHNDDKFNKTWRSIKVGKQGGAPADHLFRLAEQHGFNDHVAFEFEVLDPVDDAAPAALPKFLRNKAGQIEVTTNNLRLAIERPDVCGFNVRYDQFRDEIMLARVGTREWRTAKDEDYTRLREVLELGGFKQIKRELFREVFWMVAKERQFDSAIEWIDRLQWDGVPRVDTFLQRYFGADDGVYVRSVSRYLWTALAGRVVSPGCKADMVPILVGGQGLGKSTGVAALAPSVEFFTEVSFHEKDADLSRKMRGRLVAEIGELRGLHTKELEGIKAFITRTHEDWVPKFKEFTNQFPRRLVFIGTTNQDEFLADETGNRRWLPVRVGKADVAALERDRLQLWAEGRERYRQHGVEFRQAEELATEVHGAHMITDPWVELVEKWMDEPDALTDERPRTRKVLQANEVLRDALSFDMRIAKRADSNRMGRVLRIIGMEFGGARINGKWTKGYVWK